MKKSKVLYTALTAVSLSVLVACGGGGGGSGGQVKTGSTNTNSGGNTGNTVAPTAKAELNTVDASGTPAVKFGTSKTVKYQARVTVTDEKGVPVSGKTVAFADSAGMVQFVGNGAVLTDSSGTAIIGFQAKESSASGATTITASAKVNGKDVKAEKDIEFTASAVSNNTDPQTLVRSMDLADVTPSDKSLVIQGASAVGRSQTANIRFRVRDKDGTPVKGAKVTFSLTQGAANLNITTATSDIDGYVLTTVSSGRVPTSIAVLATVDGTSITAESRGLTVSNDKTTYDGLGLATEKFNLDGQLIGDKTKITATFTDKNGNPVADDFAVIFTTNAGSVGSSTRGGCTSKNGECSVDFIVREPRRTGEAIVVASVSVGEETFSKAIRINMSAAVTSTPPTASPKTFDMEAECKKRATFTLDDGQGRALAAGSKISGLSTDSSDFEVAFIDGGTVLDSKNLKPTKILVDFDATKVGCDANGKNKKTTKVMFKAETPGKTIFEMPVTVTYKTP